MNKTRLAVSILVAGMLAAAGTAADAKSHKHKHHSMSATTGANMKPSTSGTTGMSAAPRNSRSGMGSGGSSEGNVGPGTNNLNGPQPGGR